MCDNFQRNHKKEMEQEDKFKLATDIRLNIFWPIDKEIKFKSSVLSNPSTIPDTQNGKKLYLYGVLYSKVTKTTYEQFLLKLLFQSLFCTLGYLQANNQDSYFKSDTVLNRRQRSPTNNFNIEITKLCRTNERQLKVHFDLYGRKIGYPNGLYIIEYAQVFDMATPEQYNLEMCYESRVDTYSILTSFCRNLMSERSTLFPTTHGKRHLDDSNEIRFNTSLKKYNNYIYELTDKQMLNEHLHREEHGSPLMHRIQLPDGTTVLHSAFNRCFLEDTYLDNTTGGIVNNVLNPYKFVCDIIQKDRAKLDYRSIFQGTVLMCHPSTKQYYYKQLKEHKIRVHKYTLSDNRVIKMKNIRNSVLLITHRQVAMLESDYRLTLSFDNVSMPHDNINIGYSNVSLMFLPIYRLIVADASTINAISYTIPFIHSMRASKKLIMCNETQEVGKRLRSIDFNLFHETFRIQSMNMQKFDIDLCSLYGSLPVVNKIDFKYTPAGVDAMYQMPMYKVNNEIHGQSLMIGHGQVPETVPETCPVCYETYSSSETTFVKNNQCSHTVCIDCFEQIVKSSTYKCCLCRQTMSLQECQSFGKETSKIESMTDKINRIKQYLDENRFHKIAVLCKAKTKPYLMRELLSKYKDRLEMTTPMKVMLSLPVQDIHRLYFFYETNISCHWYDLHTEKRTPVYMFSKNCNII